MVERALRRLFEEGARERPLQQNENEFSFNRVRIY